MNSLPLHPAIVHFPIAIFIVITLLAIISTFAQAIFLKRTIFWLFIIAILSAVVAIITGLSEEETIPHNEAIHEIMEKHETNAFIISGFFVAMFLWFWTRSRIPVKKEYFVWVILMIVGCFFLAYQNYLGGEMVYGHGAGVQPMEKVLQLEEDNSGHHHH
jgi:uncharacterized membrane protein